MGREYLGSASSDRRAPGTKVWFKRGIRHRSRLRRDVWNREKRQTAWRYMDIRWNSVGPSPRRRGRPLDARGRHDGVRPVRGKSRDVWWGDFQWHRRGIEGYMDMGWRSVDAGLSL